MKKTMPTPKQLLKLPETAKLSEHIVPPKHVSIFGEIKEISAIIEECDFIVAENENNITKGLLVGFKKIRDEFSTLRIRILNTFTSETVLTLEKAMQEATLFSNDFYSISNASHTTPTGGFFICKAIMDEFDHIDDYRSIKIDGLIELLSQQKNDSEFILNELRQKATEEVTQNYARIFENEATDLRLLGNRWLIGIVTTVILFLIFIYFEDKIIRPDDVADKALVTLTYLKRLLAVSFLLFVITFVIRQYNIKMHLYTLNKHRSNTLSSYKLFIQAMGDSDLEARTQLMKEVSKSIFDAGQTGYISVKDTGDSSTIINEITKIIKPDSGK
jgi:hypothetical protein